MNIFFPFITKRIMKFIFLLIAISLVSCSDDKDEEIEPIDNTVLVHVYFKKDNRKYIDLKSKVFLYFNKNLTGDFHSELLDDGRVVFENDTISPSMQGIVTSEELKLNIGEINEITIFVKSNYGISVTPTYFVKTMSSYFPNINKHTGVVDVTMNFNYD